ncbi:MAG: RNA 2',3'-cyclic phosphodiesterase [Candidatus Omnitrophota bacterium]
MANSQIRTFIALNLPAQIINELSAVQKNLKDLHGKINWVSPDNIHLTLKFLGSTKTSDIDRIIHILKQTANDYSTLNVELSNMGIFPSLRNPRVIWVGLNEKTATINRLVKELNEKLTDLGFTKEERDFKPHLTIARIKQLNDKHDLSIQLAKSQPQKLSFILSEITFYKSTLTPKGAIYSSLYKAVLNRCISSSTMD